VNTYERRAEIIRILTIRKRETMGRLADELGVSDRTIRNDITVLTAEYPLETARGNGGCVKLAEWYHPHRNLLTQEEQRVLSRLAAFGDVHDQRVVSNMLAAYGSQNTQNGR
jgi:predicted DNA-binding transcriptional regulator YafY